jgi:hypothetical protein
MRVFYSQVELEYFTRIHTPSYFPILTLGKAIGGLNFYSGIALLVPLIMVRRVFLDRRIRFLIVGVLILAAGMTIEVFLIPHYLAPFTASFYAIGLQAMRHLRLWHPEGRPAGLTCVRLIVSVCLAMSVLRLFAAPLNLAPLEWPVHNWNFSWYGPGHFGTARAQYKTQLDQLPGKQLVIVRYVPGHNPQDEWVYNDSDIDGSKVVWARELDATDNLNLIHYYRDRKVWLAEPDELPTTVLPYPMPEQLSPASR